VPKTAACPASPPPGREPPTTGNPGEIQTALFFARLARIAHSLFARPGAIGEDHCPLLKNIEP
jgi:hypothetical protein